ncbi:MAG: PmoA family protein [Acidobacteria bacterium]|nr:PmoA family protein [Acidobacteriota bacterium]
MSTDLTRRHFMRLSSGLAAAAPAALVGAAQTAPDPRRTAPDSGELTHYQIGPHIWLRWNNEPLLGYRAHPTQKYPYFFPVTGPVSGLPLTSESSLPWPHHRSLFFGCDFVNGGNYWQDELERGQIVSRGPTIAEATPRSAVIVDGCDWRQPGQPVQMTDERRFTLSVISPRLRTLDVDLTWTASVDVTIQKNNHALFALRAAHDITPWGGGRLVSSEGREGETGTFGEPGRWCAFFGRRTHARDEPIEGIALMDHPGGPWSPCRWFTRDYGFLSPMPFNWLEHPWRLAAGRSVRIRHRVVMFAGDPRDAGLDQLYREWIRA